MPKFTDSEFLRRTLSIAATKRRLRKQHQIRKTPACEPTFIAPLSPFFAGINEEGINSKPFPKFLDLPALDDEPNHDHCMVHCKESICMRYTHRAEKPGFQKPECICDRLRSENPPEAKKLCLNTATRPNIDDLLRNLRQAASGVGKEEQIWVDEKDAHSMLMQLQGQVTRRSDRFLSLVKEVESYIGDKRGARVAYRAQYCYFKEMHFYFLRRFAEHDQGTKGSGGISKGILERDLTFVAQITLREWIPQHVDRAWMHEGATSFVVSGAEMAVWSFYQEILEDIVGFLIWRHKQFSSIRT